MGYHREVDFTVLIPVATSATETLSYALSAGLLFSANGNVQPSTGDKFFKYGLIFDNSTQGDFIGGPLTTAKGSTTRAADTYEVTGPNSVSFVGYHFTGGNGIIIDKRDRRILPDDGNAEFARIPDPDYTGYRKLGLPDGYSLSAITFDRGAVGGSGIDWYMCVCDTDTTLLENEDTLVAVQWKFRTGANDVQIWDGESSTTLPLTAYSNAVKGQEIVIRASGIHPEQCTSALPSSAAQNYYTGDPLRSVYYSSGNWTCPDANDEAGLDLNGVQRFLINSSGQFTFEDWNDGDYGDYTGSQADPPFDPNPIIAATISASPQTSTPGGNVTLSWTLANATSASIDNGVGVIAPVDGSTTVNPTTDTTYTLSAWADFGGVSADTSVTMLTITGDNCATKDDYIQICGLRDPARFGLNRYINLTEYVPQYLQGSETETFVKFFEDFLNIMYDGFNGLVVSSTELPITRDVPDDNDKYYTYTESVSSTSVTAMTSADDVDRIDYETSSGPVEENLSIPLLDGELYSQKISILEKIYRLTELQDPDLIDIEYIQFFAKNLGYDVNINRAEIGTNLGELTNQAASATSGVCDDYDRDKYLRFVVRNLPTWYKIKTTKNAIKVMLFSFGLIGDLVTYYSNDYDQNWKLDSQDDLVNIPDNYYPTPHFNVQIDLDDSINAISLDWDRRRKVINGIESIRPLNTVFERLSGYADRNITVRMSVNTRFRTNMVIR